MDSMLSIFQNIWLLNNVAYKCRGIFALFLMLEAATGIGNAQSRTVDYQENLFTVEQGITTEEGLPANGVNYILQSSDDYIWAATYNGLVRYDGTKFKIFNNSNIPGLESNRFLAVAEDEKGRIWAGLEYDNFVMIDKDSVAVYKIGETESGFNTHVSRLSFSAGGKVWIGTNNGLLTYKNGVFTRLDYLGNETVQKIISKNGYIYVLFSTKLCRLKEDGSLDKVLIEVDSQGVKSPYGREAGLSPPGNFADMDIGAGTIRVLSHGGMIKIEGEVYTDVFRRTDLRQELTYGFFPKGDTLFVYGSDGLSQVINAAGETLEVTQYTGYHLRHAIMDHEDSFWLATTTSGMRQLISTPVYQGNKYDVLSGKAVTAIMRGTRNPALFAGTNCAGLYAFHNNGVSWYGEDAGIDNTCIWSLMEQTNGSLWVGTWGKGVFYRKPGEQSFQPFKPRVMNEANAILSIYEDAAGNVWFGSYYNGLFRKSGEQVKAIHNEQGQMLPSVRTFFEEDNGRLWVATDRGVGYIEESQFKIPAVLETLKTQNIRTISKDEEGRFWFGSYTGGLFVFMPGNRLTQITLKHGLYDNTVSQFAFDASGDLWLAGNLGVFYIERSQIEAFLKAEINQLRVSKIGVNKGLPIRETTGGFMPSSYLDSSGILYIPTVQGMAAIHTNNIRLNRKKPAVHIDEVEIDGQTYLPQKITDISYKSQRLVFHFNALSFINIESVEYRYKLDGFNEDWQEVENIPQAVYTNLSPGAYTFRVTASNDDGFWNTEGAAFSFVILPPFWQTSWFYMLCVLFLGVSVTGIVKYRTRLLQRRKQELEQQVKEQTATIRNEKEQVEKSKQIIEEQAGLLKEQDEVKSRFFANISHELRTPLTLIKGMTEHAIKGKYGALGQKLAREFSAMLTHTNRLQTQVDYLLELSNIEIGDVEFNPRLYDLNTQISLLEDLFAGWADQNEVRFRFQPANIPLYVYADPEKMERILTSVFFKIMQFTRNGGGIDVKTSVTVDEEEREFVKLILSCDAKKLSEKDQKLVFDRFYYQSRVPGIPFHVGLALVKEWIELLGGKTVIESQGEETMEIGVFIPLVDLEEGEYPEKPDKVDSKVAQTAYQNPENGKQPKENKNEIKPTDKRKKTILLADDNELSRQYIRQVLKDEYNIMEAENGTEAFRKVAGGGSGIDLIISEVMLPEIDGNELSRKLRENPRTSTIPVILLTAKAGDDNYIAGLKSGADAYITKPFKESILHETIKNLITNRDYLLNKLRDDQHLQQRILEQTEHSLLAKLDKIIDDNIDKAGLSIDDIARQLHVGQRQLQRKIKDKTGLTPKQYLRKRRLSAAKLLVEQNYGTITEVAFATGFNSLSLFASYFKDEFGKLPSEWNHEDSETE